MLDIPLFPFSTLCRGRALHYSAIALVAALAPVSSARESSMPPSGQHTGHSSVGFDSCCQADAVRGKFEMSWEFYDRAGYHSNITWSPSEIVRRNDGSYYATGKYREEGPGGFSLEGMYKAETRPNSPYRFFVLMGYDRDNPGVVEDPEEYYYDWFTDAFVWRRIARSYKRIEEQGDDYTVSSEFTLHENDFSDCTGHRYHGDAYNLEQRYGEVEKTFITYTGEGDERGGCCGSGSEGGGGSCASGSCSLPAGNGHPSIDSGSYQIDLGRLNSTSSAGSVRIKTDQWSSALGSRSSLISLHSPGVSLSSDSTGPSRIDTQHARVMIADLEEGSPDNGYTVSFFQKENGAVQSSPFVRFTVAPAGGQRLRIEQVNLNESTGSVERVEAAVYEYTEAQGVENNQTLTLTQFGDSGSGDATVVLSTERISETELPNGDVLEVREQLSDGIVVAGESRLYRSFDAFRRSAFVQSAQGGEQIIERSRKILSWVRGIGGHEIIRTWTYYEEEQIAALRGYSDVAAAEAAGERLRLDPRFGKILSYISETGDWDHYVYDDQGDRIRTIRQSNENVYLAPSDPENPTALATSNIDVSVVEMEGVELGRAGFPSATVTKRIVREAGQVQRTAFSIRWALPLESFDSDFAERWEIECSVADPLGSDSSFSSDVHFLAALVADPEFLGHKVEVQYRFGPGHRNSGQSQNELNLLAKVLHADGTVTLYDRPNSTDQVVVRGHPNAAALDNNFDRAADSVVEGTRTTRRYDRRGQVEATYVERVEAGVNGGQWFAESLTRTLARDAFDRPTRTGQFFGLEALAEWSNHGTGIASSTTAQSYGCCGVDMRTDRYGDSTFSSFDDLGRTVSTTRPNGVTLHYTYDSAGRTIRIEREGDGGVQTVDGASGYDLAGRLTNQEDAAGKATFFTYRNVRPDGTAFDGAPGAGVFFQERRVYPHSASSGPVRVSWTNSQGNLVRSWTGSSSASWGTGNAPIGTEPLTELSRTTTTYDWEGRPLESRVYHSLLGLALADEGSSGEHYHTQPGSVYDTLGRLIKNEDAAGNVTVTVYEDDLPVATWAGVNSGNLPTDSSGYQASALAGLGLVQVASTTYGVYDDAESVRRLGPVVALSNFDGQDSVAVNFDDTHTVQGGACVGRVSWNKPADGVSPWTKEVYDPEGRVLESSSYANGSTADLLTHATNVYDDNVIDGDQTRMGRLIASRTHEVTSGVIGPFLETTYAYDDAGRRFKTGQRGSGHQVTVYDMVGRVKRSLLVADDGGTATVDDDLVVTETVYGYDAADNVIWIERYARHESAPEQGAGLLSANPSWAVVNHEATWYDDAHRPTHQVDYGDTAP